MNTTHTPGPWHVDGWEHMVVNDQWGTTIVVAPGSSTGTLGEMKANAGLIAAAPELFEALKEALQYTQLKLIGFRQDYPEMHAMVQTTLRLQETLTQAIAKAEGR